MAQYQGAHLDAQVRAAPVHAEAPQLLTACCPAAPIDPDTFNIAVGICIATLAGLAIWVLLIIAAQLVRWVI